MIRTRSKPVSDLTNRLNEYLLAEEAELLLQALESSQQPQQPDLCGPFSGVSTLVRVQTALLDTDTQASVSPQFQRRLLAQVLDQLQIPNATAFPALGLISIRVTDRRRERPDALVQDFEAGLDGLLPHLLSQGL